jgi:peroxiredoxin
MRHALAAAAVIALAATACSPTSTPPPSSPSSVASRAPDFTVDLLSGERFRLADHVGKEVIVIDFWTTFCQPCVGSLEHLEKAYEARKSKGLIVLAVSMDPPETSAQVPAFVRSHALTFPVAHDVESRVTELYNKKSSAPFQVLIGRDGSILRVRESYQSADDAAIDHDLDVALSVK